MAHTLKRITFTTVILFFISIASVFGEEKKDETKKIQKKGCISQDKVEGIYNGHCVRGCEKIAV